MPQLTGTSVLSQGRQIRRNKVRYGQGLWHGMASFTTPHTGHLVLQKLEAGKMAQRTGAPDDKPDTPVLFLGPRGKRERTDSHKLSPDCPTCAVTITPQPPLTIVM